MSKLRRSWIVMMVAIGLTAVAGVSWAEDAAPEEEAPAGDTVIDFAYDADSHLFVVHTATTDDDDYVCALPAGKLMVGYGAVGDNSIEFTVGDGEDVPEGAAEGDGVAKCEVVGGIVGGPNGQINHGQFMKLFHQVVGKQANGCLNRIIAQSELGKGDEQLRVSDVDEEFAPGETVTFEFKTFTAVCDHGKKDKGADHPSNKQDKKDRADRQRGNSAEAPGRNK